MSQVANDYEFLNHPGQITSVGSTTTEWLKKTFRQGPQSELERTAYITGNPNSVVAFPHSFEDRCSCGAALDPTYRDVYHTGTTTCAACNRIYDGDRQVPITHLNEVWRTDWDNELGTAQPRPITDAAIRYGRSNEFDRLIVHYMQPHHPFVTVPEVDRGTYIAPNDESREKRTATIWDQLQAGHLDEEFVWHHYAENLRYVLDDVALLLQNVDAEVPVITADHGNAMGEYGVYGHPGNVPISELVTVPWYRATTGDSGDYNPGSAETATRNLSSEEVTNRLADLGYK